MVSRRPPIQRIGIIGAGASGIASAKALLAEKCFKTIEILEQRSETGGVWNYTSETDVVPTPSTDAHAEEEPVVSEGGKPVFVSAVYDELAEHIDWCQLRAVTAAETNIPKTLMGFDGFPFPDDLPLFPPHTAVREYLQEYGRDIQNLITFNRKVVDCRKEGEEWVILTRDTRTGAIEGKRVYDAVIVAVGHYNVPYIPPIQGLDEWAKTYRESISHSRNFRRPDSYTGKKVVIVGNAASGIDIASQICQYSQCPLIQSCRSKSQLFPGGSPSHICEVSEITGFTIPDRSIHFSDGRVERDVDCVIFCTGYLQSLPFLSSLNAGENPLITDGARVNHLYQHIFYIPDQTLSIVGLPIKVMPFPTAQAAAALIARVWASRISLPSPVEMQDWEDNEVAEKGNGKEFHYMNFPKDADYIDLLGLMCEEAAGEADGGFGAKPPKWGAEERWTRARFQLIKKTYLEMKREGRVIRRQEELGFDFRLSDRNVEGIKNELEKL